MAEIYHIREPYYTAGKKFGWNPPFKNLGLGIPVDLLKGAGPIMVRVGKLEKQYIISKAEALRLAIRYDSFYSSSIGTKLAVIPWDAFDCSTQDIANILEKQTTLK